VETTDLPKVIGKLYHIILYLLSGIRTHNVSGDRNLLHGGLYTDVSTTIIRPPSRRPLCRCKHNYHTITFNDGLNTDVSTTIKRPPSRRPVYRCKHNYHTITVIYYLHADLNTTTIRPSSRRPL